MHPKILTAAALTLLTTGCSLAGLDGLSGGPEPSTECGAPCQSPAPVSEAPAPAPVPAAPARPIVVAAPTTATLTRGNETAAHVEVTGDDGPFTLRFLALPQGVHASETTLAHAGSVDVALVADEEATEGAQDIRIEVSSVSSRATASLSLLVRGRAGQLDRTFGKRGIVTTSFGEMGVGARSLALQKDGKIVAAGSGGNDYQLARYTVAGELDSSFDLDGKATTTFGTGTTYANSVVVQDDGRMVVGGVVGLKQIGLARYTGDGALDANYGIGGKLLSSLGGAADNLTASALDSEGRLVGVGYTLASGYDSLLLRFSPSGDWDATLNATGRVVTAASSNNDFANAVALQRDGKIIVVGQADAASTIDATILRYTVSGQLDLSFGDAGIVRANAGGRTRARAGIIQPDGKIVIAGTVDRATIDFFVARFFANGTLDTEFGTQGFTVTAVGDHDDTAVAVTLQPDGKLLVAGTTDNGSHTDFALVRYLATGARDADFGVNGIVVTDVSGTTDAGSSLVVQSDGRIIVGGKSAGAGGLVDFALTRYWP